MRVHLPDMPAFAPLLDHVAFGRFRPNAKNVIDSKSSEHCSCEKPVPTFSRNALARLRRSTLGAWLAVAYALAVLAAGLAPSAALAHPGLDGALLCSGLSAPGPDAPEPAGELTHCKGCPVNPVIAGPAPTLHGMIARLAVQAPAVQIIMPAPPRMAAFGLPQSRAPPAPALLRL